MKQSAVRLTLTGHLSGLLFSCQVFHAVSCSGGLPLQVSLVPIAEWPAGEGRGQAQPIARILCLPKMTERSRVRLDSSLQTHWPKGRPRRGLELHN